MDKNDNAGGLPLNNLNSATGGLAYSLNTVFYFAVVLIVSLIVGIFGMDPESDGYLYLSYLAVPVGTVACIATVLKLKRVGIKEVFPVKCKPKYYIIGILLIFGLLFSLGWVNELSVRFFKLFGYVPRGEGSYLPDLSGAKIVPALLVIALIPAVTEEAMFRGIILNCCENSAGSIRTVFIVGFCFALFHASPEQTVYQFICGCVFALIAVRSGSILPSVTMHFINNALIIILNACNMFDESGSLIISDGGNIALTVVSAICLIGALIWLILDKTPLKKCIAGGVKKFFIYASVGIAGLAVVWLCSLFGVA